MPSTGTTVSEDQQASSRRHGSLWLWVCLLVFVVYPLSTGPVFKLTPMIGGPPAAVMAIYSPLGYLYDHSHAVRAFYDWYHQKVWGLP